MMIHGKLLLTVIRFLGSVGDHAVTIVARFTTSYTDDAFVQ
jgi:phosphate uptake regulator